MTVNELSRLQVMMNELDTAILMRAWEVVESVANKLRSFHLELVRGPILEETTVEEPKAEAEK